MVHPLDRMLSSLDQHTSLDHADSLPAPALRQVMQSMTAIHAA